MKPIKLFFAAPQQATRLNARDCIIITLCLTALIYVLLAGALAATPN